MLSDQLDEFKSLLEQKSGIILVTGPTGSGKTTTLYAAIERIKKKDRKIVNAKIFDLFTGKRMEFDF